MTWKTMQEWNEKGRYIAKGQKCKLRDPDGNCLWSKEQTKKSKGKEWDDWEENDYNSFGVDYDYDYNHAYGEHMYGQH